VVAGHQGLQAAAGPHGAQLVVVADDYRLGPGFLNRHQELEPLGVVGHAGLVDQQERAGVESEGAVLQAPHHRGHGARLHAGLGGQGPDRLARHGGAQHPVAVGLEGGAHHLQRRGLAGAGHAHHHVQAPARPFRPESPDP